MTDELHTDAPAPPPASSSRFLWGIQAALLVGILGAWLWSGRRPAPPPDPLPVHATLPAFALTDAAGDRVTLADLRDTVWIADFIFTRCGGQCLDMTSRMRDLQQALDADPEVRLVSFSVDPEYDTPAVLTSYAQRHGADEQRWLFLTGARADVYRLANEGFHLGAAEASEEQVAEGADLFFHSVKFVLVDGAGQIRGYYTATDSGALHRLLADVRRLARARAS